MRIPLLTSAPATTRMWRVRYERQDGEFREISLTAATREDAVEVAARRLAEQYGPHPRLTVNGDGDETVVFDRAPVHRGIERPDLCHDQYELVSVVET